MARKDALLKLHSLLQARRAELLQAIREELGGLRHDVGGQAGGDDGDVASESINNELTSQLAQIESRELQQIDRALARLREGTYGSCEICEKKIAVARLNALPYTTYCIDCQREMERNPNLREERRSWSKVYDSEVSGRDVTVKLSDLEYKLS